MNLGIRDIIAIGVPYLIAVSACYLFGYWGTFHINALEFISFADIAKLAIYPLVISLGFFFIGLLTSQLVLAPFFPPGGGASSVIGKAGITHWRILVFGEVFLITVVYFFVPEPTKWLVIAMLAGPLSIPLTHLDKVIQFVPDPSTRATFLFLVVLLPPLSFAEGRQDAFKVKANSAAQFVDVSRSQLPLTSDEKNPVAYLGYLGNVYILRESKTGQIIIVKQHDDHPLFLSPKPSNQ